MIMRELPRLLLTAFIMALLGFAAMNHYSPGIEETIKAVALIAAGYWLGSSKGSADKTELLNNPSKVEVINAPSNPVPTEMQP